MSEKTRQLLSYVFFGGCTTVVSIGSFVLFDSVLHIHELAANVLSWVLAVAFAYWSNRKWVFRSKTRGRAMGKEMMGFYAGRVATLLMEEGILLLFVTMLSYNSTVIKLIAQAGVLVGNYVISKLLVFRK